MVESCVRSGQHASTATSTLGPIHSSNYIHHRMQAAGPTIQKEEHIAKPRDNTGKAHCILQVNFLAVKTAVFALRGPLAAFQGVSCFAAHGKQGCIAFCSLAGRPTSRSGSAAARVRDRRACQNKGDRSSRARHPKYLHSDC